MPTEITVTAEGSTMLDMSKESLPKPQAENFRARLRWALVHRFGNNKAEMGRALAKSSGRATAITGQAITQSLNATNGPGWPLVRGLSSYLGLKVDDVLAPFAESSLQGSIPASGGETPEGKAQDMGDLVVLPSAVEHARYPKLEIAVAFHAYDRPARWSRLVVGAAREGHFAGAGCESWTSPQWVEELDALEDVIRRSRPSAPDRPSSPATPLPSGSWPKETAAAVKPQRAKRQQRR